jgi:hypothetical protein
VAGAYQRDGIFTAATRCAQVEKPTQYAHALLDEADASRTFVEWQREFPDDAELVSFRFTTSADGVPTAAFTPNT